MKFDQLRQPLFDSKLLATKPLFFFQIQSLAEYYSFQAKNLGNNQIESFFEQIKNSIEKKVIDIRIAHD